MLQQYAKGRVQRVAEELELAGLEPRDRALANDLALGVVRSERLLDFALAACVERRLPNDPRTLAALRLGAFQLLCHRDIPARAAVHATVALLQRDKPFVNAVLRRLAELVVARPADPARGDCEVPLGDDRALLLPPPGLAGAVEPLAIVHSLPDFLVARWRAGHGDAAAAAIALASSRPPALFLRACGGVDGAALATRLAAEGVATAATDHPLALRVVGGAPLSTRAFAEGAFVVQDPTAVRAAESVGAAPGMTVVDLCAAPGTKATLLAERVQPDGVVFAYDSDPRRRARIAANVERLRLQRWLRVVDEVGALPQADAVLADVPCSNTGVLARRVEVRRRLVPEAFADLAAVQVALLRQALALVRPGGRAVYSTCSIEPEENAAVVAAVVGEAGDGATCIEQRLTLPVLHVRDGGYCAVLLPRAGAGVPDRLEAG